VVEFGESLSDTAGYRHVEGASCTILVESKSEVTGIWLFGGNVVELSKVLAR
jgi:hypothetical protein